MIVCFGGTGKDLLEYQGINQRQNNYREVIAELRNEFNQMHPNPMCLMWKDDWPLRYKELDTYTLKHAQLSMGWAGFSKETARQLRLDTEVKSKFSLLF